MPRRLTAAVFALTVGPVVASESFETAPIRAHGGEYVPTPFEAVKAERQSARCLGRSYDLTGCTPLPTVSGAPVLREAVMRLNGRPLKPPSLRWLVKTPAVAIAERSWTVGSIRIALKHTVQYDGFITNDLTLSPTARGAAISQLDLRLVYRPDRAVLYHIPVFRPAWAGHWPSEMKIEKPIVGVWGGDERAGFASYVATFRNWRATGPRVILRKQADGAGIVQYRVVTRETPIEKPVTFRFGFIATPVRPPEPRHWQLFSLTTSQRADELVDRLLLWGGLSDHYATFRTNKPDGDADKAALVRAIHETKKPALAYTTYAHVEEGAAHVPSEWGLMTAKGSLISRSIGGAQGHLNRTFLCPGSREWIDWKVRDIEYAIEKYGIDGFYIDTSYIIMPCANGEHGHGWLDSDGQRQADFAVWSMREIWRRAYEALCRRRGRALIYAHHKGGCPAALAAFTSAFCDGEQFTGQPIANLTLDAFRAQLGGRPIGPLGIFINEFYRSRTFRSQHRAKHHNPTEGLMLSLPHDVLATGYPGFHPVRELIALRNDLGIADSDWEPYYASDRKWEVDGARDVVVSSYCTRRGDTLLVVANPTYEDAQCRVHGPAESRRGRAFVTIDVLARIGRSNAQTPGYRWEPCRMDMVKVGARSFGLFAFVREPDSLPRFAKQRGFVTKAQATARRVPIPEGAVLISDFDDPDWVIVNDDGRVATTDRDPVDTARAMRVLPKPKHNAAALLHMCSGSPDWTKFASIRFWLRPDTPLPVRALLLRLRNNFKYTPAMTLVSHPATATLPAHKWTRLCYEFRNVPRDRVQILRIYYHRGEQCSGPFDIDEMMLDEGTQAADRLPPRDSVGGGNEAVPD